MAEEQPTHKASTVPDGPFSSKKKVLPLSNDMLKVVVGKDPESREFNIHEAVLTTRAKFFKNAMSNGWKEAEDKVVSLPEDDTNIFALYEQLVYTGSLPLFDTSAKRLSWEDLDTGDKPQVEVCSNKTLCQDEYTSLAKLYVLSEKLGDVDAKNIAIRAIIGKIMYEESVRFDQGMHLPGPDAINTIYEGTAGDCPGRKLLVHAYIIYGNDYTFQDVNKNEMPYQFLGDLAVDAFTYRSRPRFHLSNECDVEKYLEDVTGKARWYCHQWNDFMCW